MAETPDTPLRRLIALILGALRPPPGRGRILLAYSYGIVCHVIFGLSVLAMIIAMFFGMSRSFGTVPAPWSYLANAALVLQFPLAHSILLSRRGGRALRVVPGEG